MLYLVVYECAHVIDEVAGGQISAEQVAHQVSSQDIVNSACTCV